MDESIVKEVLEKAAQPKERDYFADFGEKGYTPLRIVEENFKDISGKNFMGKIAFIDGGNAEISNGPNFSLQLFRIYYCIYHDKKRISNKKEEFYGLTSIGDNPDGLIYSTKIFNQDNETFEYDLFDETLKEGLNKVKISKLGDVIRRFSELKAAIEVIDHLEEGDIVVLDGSLEVTFNGEKKYFDKLYRKAIEKKVIILGFSKSTILTTKKGSSLTKTLFDLKPHGAWFYSSIVEVMNDNHKADIYFTKLHPQSNYIFRVDVFDSVEYDPEVIFNALYNLSKDPIFLGYPYGLVDADKFARVSNQEKEIFKTHLKVKCGKDWEKIEALSRSQNAHNILDGKF
ncbi:DNA double-strand break repair nuclease NurA [Nanoarchaeota archaeon]